MQRLDMKDPRAYQLMVLSSMLLYGLIWLKFSLNPISLFLILMTVLLSQLAATRFWKLSKFEWRSAMISGLSLCILMRCPSLAISLGLAAIAIFSKFIFRANGKHIFNPTNFALALGLITTNQVSVVPGQWGSGATLAFFILCMGIFVANKACRSDISIAFLGTYALALFVHASWVGESFQEPLHRMQTGSLLIFTFFMISDPRSTPDSRVGRIIFGVATALIGFYLQTTHKIPGGLLIALSFISLLTPLLDFLLVGEKFEWNRISGGIQNGIRTGT